MRMRTRHEQRAFDRWRLERECAVRDWGRVPLAAFLQALRMPLEERDVTEISLIWTPNCHRRALTHG